MQKRKNFGFSGTVEGLKLQDVIQMACIGASTSTISALRGNQRGYLYISRGRPVHASAGGLTGQEALTELISWSGGTFDLRWGIPPRLTQNLSGSHDALLMEATRVLDEQSDSDQGGDQSDARARVELSRSSAAAVLELIYARRKQELWGARTRKMLVTVVAVAVGFLGVFLLRGGFAPVVLNAFLIAMNGLNPQAAPKSFGAAVKVAAGEFFYQDGEHRTLPAFDMDPVEVTIGQYAEFLRAVGSSTEYDHPNQPVNKGHANPRWAQLFEAASAGLDFEGTRLSVNDPAVYVDWFDAYAYARWKRRRLPSEEEWEKAARGIEGRRFPWGSDEQKGAANIYEGDASKKWSEPTSHPLDRSVYGVYDMAGNVSEWTQSVDPQTGQPVVRGGNFGNPSAEITRRVNNQPFTTLSDRIGFRTVCSLEP